MFKDFAKVWTPVLRSRDLRNKPVPLQIANESIVLFRPRPNAAAALWDQCPHRGVALSMGAVTPHGTLACRFHGWEFNGDGSCHRVPLNPDAKCARLPAVAFPVHEAGGLVWLYTQATGDAVEPPHVPEAMVDPAYVRYSIEVTWKTHWTRAMENMLDSPHVPFVHQRTIGRGLRKHMRPDSRMQVSWDPTPHGAFMKGVLDDKHDAGTLEFNRPNGMVLHLDGGPGRIRMHVFCIPVHDRATRLLVVSGRDFGRYNPIARLFDELNRVIVLEDRAVVESSKPAEVPPPGDEHSVASDRATLQFRKYYYDQLKDSGPRSLRVVGAPPTY